MKTFFKICLRDRCAWFTRIIYYPCDMIKITRYVKYDDVRRDSMINFVLTWHKRSFPIGHFEFEV